MAENNNKLTPEQAIEERFSLIELRLESIESIAEKNGNAVDEITTKKVEKKKLPSFSKAGKIFKAKVYQFTIPSKEGVNLIKLEGMSDKELADTATKYPSMFKEQ